MTTIPQKGYRRVSSGYTREGDLLMSRNADIETITKNSADYMELVQRLKKRDITVWRPKDFPSRTTG